MLWILSKKMLHLLVLIPVINMVSTNTFALIRGAMNIQGNICYEEVLTYVLEIPKYTV